MKKYNQYWVIAVLLLISYSWFNSYRNTPPKWDRIPFGSIKVEQEHLSKDTTYYDVFDSIGIK